MPSLKIKVGLCLEVMEAVCGDLGGLAQSSSCLLPLLTVCGAGQVPETAEPEASQDWCSE